MPYNQKMRKIQFQNAFKISDKICQALILKAIQSQYLIQKPEIYKKIKYRKFQKTMSSSKRLTLEQNKLAQSLKLQQKSDRLRKQFMSSHHKNNDDDQSQQQSRQMTEEQSEKEDEEEIEESDESQEYLNRVKSADDLKIQKKGKNIRQNVEDSGQSYQEGDLEIRASSGNFYNVMDLDLNSSLPQDESEAAETTQRNKNKENQQKRYKMQLNAQDNQKISSIQPKISSNSKPNPTQSSPYFQNNSYIKNPCPSPSPDNINYLQTPASKCSQTQLQIEKINYKSLLRTQIRKNREKQELLNKEKNKNMIMAEIIQKLKEQNKILRGIAERKQKKEGKDAELWRNSGNLTNQTKKDRQNNVKKSNLCLKNCKKTNKKYCKCTQKQQQKTPSSFFLNQSNKYYNKISKSTKMMK